jgi:hypothetical protein
MPTDLASLPVNFTVPFTIYVVTVLLVGLLSLAKRSKLERVFVGAA